MRVLRRAGAALVVFGAFGALIILCLLLAAFILLMMLNVPVGHFWPVSQVVWLLIAAGCCFVMGTWAEEWCGSVKWSMLPLWPYGKPYKYHRGWLRAFVAWFFSLLIIFGPPQLIAGLFGGIIGLICFLIGIVLMMFVLRREQKG